jgi:hypothetical protein
LDDLVKKIINRIYHTENLQPETEIVHQSVGIFLFNGWFLEFSDVLSKFSERAGGLP